MKATRLEKLYIGVLVVIFGGIVLHAPVSVGLGVLFPKFDLLIKAWKEILMICISPVAIIIVTKHKLWRELLNDWIVRIIFMYVALHFILLLVMRQTIASEMAGLAIDLRYVLFFGLVYIAIRVMPQYRRRMLKVGLVGACIVVGFASLQLFLPPDILSHIGYSKDTIAPYLTVDKNTQYIRVNSTLRGPNPLGAYAGMVLALLMAALVRGKLRLSNTKTLFITITFATCSIIALWISYSRSALIAGIIAVLLVVCLTTLRKVPRRVWVVSILVTSVLAVSLVLWRGSSFVSNVLLHDNPTGGSSTKSDEGHILSLKNGVNEFVHSPLGNGVGSTGSASLLTRDPVIVENQYLFIAHEVGWIGFGLFITLYGLILTRLWQKRDDWLALGVFASGVGLGLIGLLLPVWVDDTVSIVWWGLVAIALTGGEHDRKQAK